MALQQSAYDCSCEPQDFLSGESTIVQKYIEKFPVEHCFETPNIHALDEALQSYGFKVCFMAEYFLPDVTVLKAQPCDQ